ncbi:MAG: heavy metal translocating P-type ATPase [Desulfobaccales bacterium]
MQPGALEKFSIQHAIHGRLRIKVKVWKVSEDQAQALTGWLANQGEVREVQVHPLSRSIILYYDPRTTSAQVVLDLVDRGLTLMPTLPTRQSRAATSLAGSGGLWSGLLRVMGLTAFLGYHLVGSVLFASPLSPGLITLVAVLGGLPLLRDALSDLTQGRVIGLNPFLGSACVLAIATGESLTALEVIWVREVGDTLEQYVADRSRRAIREILEVSTRNTWVWVDGEEVETPVYRVQRGDLVIVSPAEKIPVDGEIVRGEALVDESQITGRSEPELRRVGDAVFAGTIVQQGKLHILAEKVGEHTYLSQVLALVEQSLANRSQAEKRADLLAARLTRLGMAATAATLLLTGNLATAIAVQLVMACPCATVLAASTAVTAALTNAARHRVLIKGGLYLERLEETDCICFDKTGTLTTDVPEVTEIITRSPTLKAERVLGLAAAAEAHNPHPLARALVKAAGEAGEFTGPFATPEIVLGRGVRTQVDGDHLVVGNLPFMQEEGIDIRYFQGQADRLEDRGRSVVYVAKNGKVQGIIGISYLLRPEVPVVLSGLRREGVREMHLVSGDTEPVVRALAQRFNFEGSAGALLPGDKSHYVEELVAAGRRVAVVGDGVNDALALSRAQVGVAMGAGGAEAAIAAADIALADSDLSRLLFVRRLSRQTLRVIEQNYWLAVSTDLLGALLIIGGRLGPLTAGAIHVVHTLGIFFNSSRLLGWRPPQEKGEAVLE